MGDKIDDFFEEMKKGLGKRLRRFRGDSDWTQEELAEQDERLYRTKIANVETGKDNIEFFTLIRIATSLQLDLFTLFDFIDTRPPHKNKSTDPILRFEKEKKLFGKRISQLIKHRKLDRQALNLDTGIAESDVTLITKGEKNFKLYQLARFASGLKVNVADLFDYNGPLPDNTGFKRFQR